MDTTSKLQPESGTLYINKTYRYLMQHYNQLDPDFFKEASGVFFLGFGIGDYAMTECTVTGNVYMLIDTYGVYDSVSNKYVDKLSYVKAFIAFYDYISAQDYFHNDYKFDDPLTGHLVMIVLKGKNSTFIDNFINGEYSKLYDVSPFSSVSLQHKVITKDKFMKLDYAMKLGNAFDVVIDDYNIDDYINEYDFKPILKQEIFNYPNE